MERLDHVVARVLAGLRVMTEEEAGGTAGKAAPPLARGPGGEHPGARNGDRLSPRTTVRRGASQKEPNTGRSLVG